MNKIGSNTWSETKRDISKKISNEFEKLNQTILPIISKSGLKTAGGNDYLCRQHTKREYWYTGIYWHTGVPVYWHTGLPVYGILVYQYTDIPVYWYAVIL